MARKPMVTRTLKATKADVLCVNTVGQKTFVTTVTLPRTYKCDEDALRVARGMIDDETVKAVRIMSRVESETLYGMSEAKFMKLADILPPRKGETDAETKSENTDVSEK